MWLDVFRTNADFQWKPVYISLLFFLSQNNWSTVLRTWSWPRKHASSVARAWLTPCASQRKLFPANLVYVHLSKYRGEQDLGLCAFWVPKTSTDLDWSRKLCICETFVGMKVELYVRIWIYVIANFRFGPRNMTSNSLGPISNEISGHIYSNS